jgi:hypothetical protein
VFFPLFELGLVLAVLAALAARTTVQTLLFAEVLNFFDLILTMFHLSNYLVSLDEMDLLLEVLDHVNDQ